MAGQRHALRVTLVVLAAAIASPAVAYNFFYVRDGERVRHPQQAFPVQYFVSTGSTPPSMSAREFADIVERAIQAWQTVETADVSFDDRGPIAVPWPDLGNGLSEIGFVPYLSGSMLAQTRFWFRGDSLEVDIAIAADVDWGLGRPGDTGPDLMHTIVHELGHLLGLEHSPLGESRWPGYVNALGKGSIMFPGASHQPFELSQITADDAAGLSVLYPSASFSASTGIVAGRVVQDGSGVVGAHVVAFDPVSGELVGALALEDGRFEIEGLAPGPKLLRAEPIDELNSSAFMLFLHPSIRSHGVDADFQPTFYGEYVWVSPGQTSDGVLIEVAAR